MIFNEQKCINLYLDYVEQGDTTAITKLIAESEALVNVFALRFGQDDPALIDDLRQVGAIKIYDIIRNKKYRPGKGKLHSLLSSVLPNTMVDLLRKQKEVADPYKSVEDMLEEAGYHNIGGGLYRNGDGPDVVKEFQQRTVNYAAHRFPSLPQAQEAALYTSDTLMENARYHKILSTLSTIYHIKPSNIFHRAIKAHFAALLAHQTVYEDEAMAMVNSKTEWSLRPEVMLVAGPQVYAVLSYFLQSASVRF